MDTAKYSGLVAALELLQDELQYVLEDVNVIIEMSVYIDPKSDPEVSLDLPINITTEDLLNQSDILKFLEDEDEDR